MTNADKMNHIQCTTINAWSGQRRARCTRKATGADGMCTRCRNEFAATRRAYTCRACGTAGLVGPSTCAEHKHYVFDYTDSIGPLTEYGTFYTSGYAYDEGEVMPCGHECGDCYC